MRCFSRMSRTSQLVKVGSVTRSEGRISSHWRFWIEQKFVGLPWEMTATPRLSTRSRACRRYGSGSGRKQEVQWEHRTRSNLSKTTVAGVKWSQMIFFLPGCRPGSPGPARRGSSIVRSRYSCGREPGTVQEMTSPTSPSRRRYRAWRGRQINPLRQRRRGGHA